MLAELLARLRGESVIDDHKTYAERIQERQMLRAEVDAYKAEKEAELAQIAEAMSGLDYADAVAESFGGGPSSDNGNDGDDNA